MGMVLDFKDYESWMPILKTVVDKYNIQSLENQFIKSDTYLSIKDIREIIGNEIIIELHEYILNNYKHIVFYHATATNNIESFYKNGLLLMDIKRQNEYARKIFNSKEFPEITDAIFEKACSKVKNEVLTESGVKLRKNKIFFCLDDSHLLYNESASHYLVYGSEYLLILAQHLGLSWNTYPKVLEDKLTSTLFKCKVDISIIYDEDLSSLIENIIVRYFDNIIYPDEKLEEICSCIEIYENLDSSNIISHTHPENIKCSLKKSMYGRY